MANNPNIANITVSTPSVGGASTILQGQQGVQGPQGIQGPTGAKGNTGDQGPPGTATIYLASASQTGVASFGNEFVVSTAGAVSLTANYVKSFNGSTGPISFAVPLASATVTGVASFGNEFVVTSGAVGLTSNYVKSVNGKTGNVGLPLASSSATGVASFGNEFTVSTVGAVGLTSNYVKTFNNLTGTVSFAVPLASSSATGVASFGNEFTVSAIGAVSLTSNYVKTFNGLTGTVSFAVPLASSSVTGVASFGNQFVVSAVGAVSLTSNYVISVNGITGPVTGIATTVSNTFTGLQTLSAGLTTTHLYVSQGATFANGLKLLGASTPAYHSISSDASNNLIINSWNNQSYTVGSIEKLSIGAAGISATGLYVSTGATFASGMSVTGGTAYFYRDVYLATGANHPGIVDYEFAANTGVTYPSASTPAYTVGDKWSNGSIEYTWNGSAWIENTDNIISSSPIAFDSIVPSQSITPSKLSLGGPSWINGGSFTTNQSELRIKGFAVQPSLGFLTNADALVGAIVGDSDSLRLHHKAVGNSPLLTLFGPQGAGVTSSVTIGGNLLVTYGNNSNGFGANVNIAGNLQCTGNAVVDGSFTVGNFTGTNLLSKPSGSTLVPLGGAAENPVDLGGADNPNPAIGQLFRIEITTINSNNGRFIGRSGQTWLCIVKGGGSTKDLGITVITGVTSALTVLANSQMTETSSGNNMCIVGWRIS
jgi:hypothetical protein